MSKVQEKTEAITLRKRGKSISEIARALGVSKSSVSVWCRDITLTKSQEEYIHKHMVTSGHKGRMLGAEINRKKKLDKIEKYIAEGKLRLKKITRDEKFLIGLGLYWGEGVKTHQSATGFSNSDPDSILFMKNWFTECLGIENERFIPRIYLNSAHKDREKEVLRFWSDLLELPRSQFGNTVLVKNRNKKVFTDRDKYKGVMLLTVSKGSDLKYKILGYIEALRK